MKRYVVRASEWWEHQEHRAGLTVHESDREPRWSGLYDAAGNKLFAVDEMEPIGFRMEESMKKPVKMPMKPKGGKKKGC